MVLSNSTVRGTKEKFISLYMPMVTGHLPDEAVQLIEEVKTLVDSFGGKKNVSCRFLKRGCTDTIVHSENSSVYKGTLQIPRSRIPKKVLRLLDSGT